MMSNINNLLDAQDECFLKISKYLKSGRDLFASVKKTFQANFKVDDLDSEIFEEFNIFEKDKNVDNKCNFLKIDKKGNLMKTEEHLNHVIKNLDSNRTELFKQCMSQVKIMSQQIQSVEKALAFIKQWQLKVSDDYDLKRYPNAFMNYLKEVPSPERSEIFQLLSKLHPIEMEEEKENSASYENILRDSTNRIIAKDSPSSGMEDSTASLPSFIKKALPVGLSDRYRPGYTIDANISVLDYTKCESGGRWSDVSAAVKAASDVNDYSVLLNISDNGYRGNAGTEDDYCDDPLNQAISNIEEEGEGGGITQARQYGEVELPSFLNDSARCPEIERPAFPYDSLLENEMVITVEGIKFDNDISIDRYSLCGLTGIENRDSVCEEDNGNSTGNWLTNDLSSSRIECSSINIDYSLCD